MIQEKLFHINSWIITSWSRYFMGFHIYTVMTLWLIMHTFYRTVNPRVFWYIWNHQICSQYEGFVTHFRCTADEKFHPRFFLYQHRKRLSISVRVPWNIFGIQGLLVPVKCILEAFGTGVPNGIVTVKPLIMETSSFLSFSMDTY